MADQEETRACTVAQVKAGISLKPGHKTVVVLSDAKPRPQGDGDADDAQKKQSSR